MNSIEGCQMRLDDLLERKSELLKEKHKLYQDESGYVERSFALTSIAAELQFVNNQIALAEQELKKLKETAGQHNESQSSVVSVGDRVTVSFVESKQTRSFILTIGATGKKGFASTDSYSGKAVYGKSLGDTVELVTPNGKRMAQIVGLEKAQELEISQPNA